MLPEKQRPDDAAVARHLVQGHLPSADWCSVCFAAKARGQYYKKIPHDEMKVPVINCDYCLYSVRGVEVHSSYEVVDHDKAIPVFVACGVRTGHSLAMQVAKKGADAHAIANFRFLLEELVTWSASCVEMESLHYKVF